MFDFPLTEPEITLTPLDEPSFDVQCEEYRWWFIVPEFGDKRRWATYDYPARKMVDVSDLEVLGQTRIHGEECHEIRYRHFAADGSRLREAYGYGAVRDERVRWFGWWNLSDVEKIYTWRDPDFAWDWADCSVRLVDNGKYRWLDETRFVNGGLSEANFPNPTDAIGAGVWRVRIGDAEHRCLRVIDVSDPPNPLGPLCEGFLNENGRTVFWRRYNAAERPLRDSTSAMILADSPTLTYGDAVFCLWYDCIPEDSFTLAR